MYCLRVIIPDDVEYTEIENNHCNFDDLKNEVEIYLYEMTVPFELTVFYEQNIKMTVKGNAWTGDPIEIIYEPEIGVFQNTSFVEPKHYDIKNLEDKYYCNGNINCIDMIIPFMLRYLHLSKYANEFVNFVNIDKN